MNTRCTIATAVAASLLAVGVAQADQVPNPEFAYAQRVAKLDPVAASLLKKLYFTHDNGGSEVDQCVVILQLKLNAQQNSDATQYQFWTNPAHYGEMLFEYDAQKVGLDVNNMKHWTKADNKKIAPYVLPPISCG